jgi:hypothetical protein
LLAPTVEEKYCDEEDDREAADHTAYDGTDI